MLIDLNSSSFTSQVFNPESVTGVPSSVTVKVQNHRDIVPIVLVLVSKIT